MRPSHGRVGRRERYRFTKSGSSRIAVKSNTLLAGCRRDRLPDPKL